MLIVGLLVSFIVCFAFWFLLSWNTSFLLLSFGICSAAFTVFFAYRALVVSRYGTSRNESDVFSYKLLLLIPYIFLEILKSNIAMVRVILRPKTISPHILKMDVSPLSPLGQVVFANIVTITPGTTVIKLDSNVIEIHCLTESAAADLASYCLFERVFNIYPTR